MEEGIPVPMGQSDKIGSNNNKRDASCLPFLHHLDGERGDEICLSALSITNGIMVTNCRAHLVGAVQLIISLLRLPPVGGASS